jgi:biopolymer transport protein ExbD
MRRIAAAEAASPLTELNTTPLIDVMLVLLVMFIITIPIQTHAVKLDLPTCAHCPEPHATVNTVFIGSAGQIAWNGHPISTDDLKYLLRQTQQMRPTPGLHLSPDAKAPYGNVDEVLAIIKRAEVDKFGFVGNEAYANLWPARLLALSEAPCH